MKALVDYIPETSAEILAFNMGRQAALAEILSDDATSVLVSPELIAKILGMISGENKEEEQIIV